jgi:hypothetical protein
MRSTGWQHHTDVRRAAQAVILAAMFAHQPRNPVREVNASSRTGDETAFRSRTKAGQTRIAAAVAVGW